MQTHLYSYHYYTEEHWSIWGGIAPMVTKFKAMSRIWIGWGLVYPSGPTYRVGIATIIAASESDVVATLAHELLKNFKDDSRFFVGSVRETVL